MKRPLLFIALICASFCAVAQAPIAGSADSARAKPVAASEFDHLSRLAANGDRDAMLMLGKIYWSGAGVDVDRDRADSLFRRAAAAGHPDAAQALSLSERRRQQDLAIRYWTTEVSADRLTGGAFSCVRPDIPQSSMFRPQAVVVSKAYEAYRRCYNGYVDKLYGDAPAEQRIPAELRTLMSDMEIDQARSLIDTTVVTAIRDIKRQSGPLLADIDRWAVKSATVIVNEQNRWIASRVQVESEERIKRGY